MDQIIISKIGSLFVKAKNILIVLGAEPTADSTAAALALQLSLNEAGKQAITACSEPIKVNLNRLIGVDKITSKVGSQNLVISFDYIPDSIDKVSTNITGNRFNIIIKPQAGFPAVDSQKISFSYTGVEADVIVVVGCKTLESIGRIYREEQSLFMERETINIDNSMLNARFGKTNLLEVQSSSVSELVGLLIKNLNMPLNADIATNLLAGVETATGNLSYKTRAETFELMAELMKAGGRRGQLEIQTPKQSFDNKPFMIGGSRQPAVENNQRDFPPTSQKKQIFQPSNQQEANNRPAKNSYQAPSPDWLKPKIYKGSSRIN
jgi:hypothetical protein